MAAPLSTAVSWVPWGDLDLPYHLAVDTAGGARILTMRPWTGFTGRAVVVYHWYNGDVLTLPALPRAFVLAWLRAGYLVSISDLGGDLWGNPFARSLSAAHQARLAADYGVTQTVLCGISGGGITSLLDVAGASPSVRGWLGIMPACGLRALYDATHPTVMASIEAAYGITPGGANFTTQTAGHDPLTIAPSAFAGKWMRWYASPDDPVVPKALHSDALAARVSGFALGGGVFQASGGHGDPSHAPTADVLAFLAQAFA